MCILNTQYTFFIFSKLDYLLSKLDYFVNKLDYFLSKLDYFWNKLDSNYSNIFNIFNRVNELYLKLENVYMLRMRRHSILSAPRGFQMENRFSRGLSPEFFGFKKFFN